MAKGAYREIRDFLSHLYIEDGRPWLVGFSGGKDSTMLASLIFDAVLSIPMAQRKKPVSVLCTDTRVEIPAIVEMVTGTLARMQKFSQQNGLNIEVALLKPRSVDYHQQALRRILAETERMIEMVRTLLLLARSDTHSLVRENEILDLHLLFHDEYRQLRQFADEKNQQVAFLPAAAEMFLVQGDELLLRQVYRNLFLNAVQYTPPSGQITIELAQDERQVRFRISDKGVGISPAEVGRIFDRFYRVQQQEARPSQGSGLGLPLAKMIVEMHDGKISVTSQIGAGTTVQVDLPRFHAQIRP